MMPAPESPIAADESINDADAASPETDDAREFPGRVRGQRLEITPADLTMYSAITGRDPSSEERERALAWAESDPANEAIASAIAPATPSTTGLLPTGYALRPWHPTAISLRVRDIWFNGITLKTARPQITHWLRRLSLAIQEGKKRVTQAR